MNGVYTAVMRRNAVNDDGGAGGGVGVITCGGNYQSWALQAPSSAPRHAEQIPYLHQPPQASAAALREDEIQFIYTTHSSY